MIRLSELKAARAKIPRDKYSVGTIESPMDVLIEIAEAALALYPRPGEVSPDGFDNLERRLLAALSKVSL